ncbi:MAG: hypothetical protein Q7R49_01835 [Candidatus Daviesbacteria bacterium]|nr:hypothetical protein [Candidatus Daviesbacteria bacterium]
MLDSLDSKNTNIANLNLEEPQGKLELPFDPDRDLTEADWEGMLRGLDDISLSNVTYYLNVASGMRIIFPERELNLDKNSWNRTEKQIKDSTQTFWANRDRTDMDCLDITSAISSALQLFPEKANQLKDFYAEFKDKANDVGFNIFESLDRYFRRVPVVKIDTISYLGTISSIAIVSQADLKTYPKLEDFKQDFLTALQDSFAGYNKGLSSQLLHAIAAFRICFPEQELNIPKQVWDEWKESFELLRKNARNSNDPLDWWGFTRKVFDLKVATAKEVKITDHGIELIMQEPEIPLVEPIPALPEMRKF